MDAILDRKVEVGQKIGVAPESIMSVIWELETLRKQGILIDLNVSGIGMFSVAAKWDEIGIQANSDDPRLERLRPGQKYVLPVKEHVEELKSIQTLMRNTLDRMTYKVTGFYPYRWLPFTAYERFTARWAELKDRFERVKAKILDEIDGYTEMIANQAAQEAEQSWKSIKGQGYDWVIIDSKPYDHDGYVDYQVRRDTARIPSVEKIERELQADYIVALVYTPQDIEAENLAVQQLRDRAELEHERARAAKQEAYLQERLIQEQYDHQRRMNQLEQNEKELRIEAMLHAEAEHARMQLKSVASPFEEVFTALRRQIANDASEILASIQKNGFVRGKVAERGRGLVELFDLMAVQDDRELREKLVALRNAIGSVGSERAKDAPERSTAEVVTILQQIQELEHEAATDLLKGPSRFNLVEV
jgi:hypothetical protein